MRTTGLKLITLTACVLTAAFSSLDGQAPPPKVVKKSATSISSVAGADTFREYCAVCHGIGGRGNGPAASALKVPPPDLTMLDHVHRDVEFSGPLSDEQRARLLDIATKCPVHRTLDSEIVIETHLTEPGVSGVSA